MKMTRRSVGPDPRRKSAVATRSRRIAILGAARRVFGARGFESACVEDIAHLAGVAKGTVYLYYPSKEDMYRAALKEGLREMCLELRRQVEAARTVRAKLVAFVETKLAYVEAHRDFFRIYSAALPPSHTPLRCRRDFRDSYRAQVDVLRGALAGTRDPEAAALVVHDVLRGVIERRLHGPSTAVTDTDPAEIVNLLWKGLKNA